MRLRLALAARYLSAVLLPLAVFLAFSRPQRESASKAQVKLSLGGGQIQEATQRLVASLPPPRPGIPKRLDAVAALKVPGVKSQELSRTASGRPSVRLALRGGYWELVSFLDAAGALPYPGRAVSLSVSPAAEGEELEGEATFEVEP